MIMENKNNILYIDGCSTAVLAKKYGTPLYVMSETSIKEKFKELRECFLEPYKGTRVAYACKAFCTLAMMKLVEQEGMCIDVVSGGELYTAVKAGFPPHRIEFNGNNKSREELEMAVDYGIGRIIIDGLQELDLIHSICKEKAKKVQILYRITPGVKSDSHDYIVTGKKDSKFGIPLDQDVIYPAIEAAIKCESVEFLGFHFHVGSQLFDNHSHLAALETALKLIKETKARYGFIVKELNIGGGFGIKYTDEERKSFEYFLTPMMRRIISYSEELGIPVPEVVIEPGRSIVGEAGISLYTVGSIKEIKGIRKYVSVDGGMTDNIRPALYQAKYEGMLANKTGMPKTDVATICGKCCESGDILIKDLHMAPAAAGDLLAIFSTGAYCYAMASNYNKLGRPAVIFVCQGEDKLVVKRQTYEDQLAGELIP